MGYWAIVFLLLSGITGMVGFTSIAALLSGAGQFLFGLFFFLFLLTYVPGLLARGQRRTLD